MPPDHPEPHRPPSWARAALFRHRQLLRFAVVGGICFVLTNAVNYALKLTVLTAHPVTALGVAVLVATIVSYVLNREWSFHDRGGRERHHEAALFFLISGVSLGLNAAPLAVSRYLLGLRTPAVDLLTQEVADFVSGIVIGTLVAMAFRWWALKRWVFPRAGVRVVRGGGERPAPTGKSRDRAA
ncbi:Putative flippase GtrA (transmembrane translocase of bactoprenol-linked glucose) [Amycolatopsis arida]|uniref:Putative flippase GtrA (Transmembrane translocase of bactoprenol-linked glucose) n=1 Tax=Amycolatopsis arida TaxID=587909 RepID=A0A1I5WP23_9PSEU|nr:GtrA family protein [Amycolatopsis arida]TDX92362.1 putative flippase GtrA [Amycolatopsis arida]SFQ21146.1 Putative flippase GtrA (transmembrane translocase of bactoprenol-linked glucose) [Amycolatopsis arida]